MTDMQNTVELIRNFWPEFPISKENFQHPTSEFVYQFFTKFIGEVHENTAAIANTEAINLGDEDHHGLGMEVDLYLKVSPIFKKLMYKFTVLDILDPIPKRVYPLLKTAIHFLIHMNNNLDEMESTASAVFVKGERARSLKMMKQQALQEIAYNSEDLARAMDTNEQLTAQLETFKQADHAKMLEDKAERDKAYVAKMTERNNLEIEIDNLEYEFRDLEDEEKKLKVLLVPESGFENLKKAMEHLELEHQQIKERQQIEGHNVDDVAKEYELKKSLDKCVLDLQGWNFESTPVTTLQQLRGEVLLQTSNAITLEENRKLQDGIIRSKTESVKSKNQQLGEYQKLCNKVEGEMKQNGKQLQNLTATRNARHAKSQKMKARIIRAQENIREIDADGQLLLETVLQHLRIIQNADETMGENFANSLSRFHH